MELSNDNWRVIFSYLSETHLILIKTCNKYLYNLIRATYKKKLSYNIHEVLYNNYRSLLTDYLYPMLGLGPITILLPYCASLSCSTDLVDWLYSIFESNYKEHMTELVKGFLSGAERSGNLVFIDYIYNKFNCDFESIVTRREDVYRSMSKLSVQYIFGKFHISKLATKMNISSLFENKVEKSIGFERKLSIEYLDYLDKELKVLNQETLFLGVQDQDISFTEYLIKKGYIPSVLSFKFALIKDRFDLTGLYLKVSKEYLRHKYLFIVSSIHSYKYAKSLNLNIDLRGSLTQTIRKKDFEAATILLSQGASMNNDVLKNILPLEVEQILYLKSKGFDLPPNIYGLMLEWMKYDITLEFFQYLQENGYHDSVNTPSLLFASGNKVVIKEYLSLGIDMHTDIILSYLVNMGRMSRNIIDVMIECKRELPENIVDILSRNINYIDLGFDLAKLGYQTSKDTLTNAIKYLHVKFIEFLLKKTDVTICDIISHFYQNYGDDEIKIFNILINNYSRYCKK